MDIISSLHPDEVKCSNVMIYNFTSYLYGGTSQLQLHIMYVTGFGINGLIAGLVKIDFFFPEKASTKFKYCLRKI